ncbi:uncharacterized protein LOC128546402 [Mercenaria mercenaria]|uniref:uncharacterized protein LOC128546402 n=1 Tax=Mercenaria mercenaria TaxID=6596 RepID=UPI00234E8168|nr:uncharacterized protein LOC128546402 [Mercenaria mercenaria]
MRDWIGVEELLNYNRLFEQKYHKQFTVNPDVTVTAEPEPEPVAEGGPGNLLPLYIIIPIAVIVIAIVLVLLIIRMRRKKRNRELKSKWSMKTSQGKMNKKRKNSLTEGSHLCHENVGMYDITAEDNNPANKKDRPTTKQKPFKRNANPNFSNNLNATVSLDNVLADIDTFANDTFKTDNKKSSAFDSDSTKQLMDKDGETSTKKVVDDGKPAPQADVTAHDADKADNEYARINKVRKVSAPKIDSDGQMYDKLGDEKKDKNVNGLDPNYDRVKLDGESYNTTSKPMTVPDRDKLYDGLSRF